MKFRSYCPHCKHRVIAYTVLTGNELKLALASNLDIEIIHTAEMGHQWRRYTSTRRELCVLELPLQSFLY
jgi:hypothetical protein